jgi:hypothetical protein
MTMICDGEGSLDRYIYIYVHVYVCILYTHIYIYMYIYIFIDFEKSKLVIWAIYLLCESLDVAM